MARMLYTKPRREKLAKALQTLIEEKTGKALIRDRNGLDELDGDTIRFCYHESYRDGELQTPNGKLRWANFQVCKHGVSIHIAFDDPDRAKPDCPGINPHSGKWNHYVWPQTRDNKHAAQMDSDILHNVEMIVEQIKPV